MSLFVAELLGTKPGVAIPTPTFKQQAAQSSYGVNPSQIVPVAIAAADLLVVGMFSTALPTSVSDNINGAWTEIVAVTSTYVYSMWYKANSAAAAANAMTISASAGVGSAIFTALDYKNAGALDQGHGLGYATAAGIGTTVASGPTSTLTAGGELVIGAGYIATSSAITPGSGYTLRTTSPNTQFMQDELAGSSAGQSSSLTIPVSSAWISITAAFQLL
jgi:hypothetical protein